MRQPMIVPVFGHVGQSHTPGKCAMCGTSASDRRVVCTGIRIEGIAIGRGREGFIQLCEECVKRLGELIGLVPSDVVARLESKAAELEEDRKALAKVHASLETSLKKVQAIVK